MYSGVNVILNLVNAYFLVLVYFELKRLEHKFECLLPGHNFLN